ncbi:hypothetical protein ACI3K5_02700 [Streptomyces sp. MPA0124]|uniref:hypothetical protein n=1 Tax=Streptomyces sp. MPA0124 TaxID=3378069 RepID=UPI001382990F|nr:hypothetical protein [Streptomyces sp. SID6013]
MATAMEAPTDPDRYFSRLAALVPAGEGRQLRVVCIRESRTWDPVRDDPPG